MSPDQIDTLALILTSAVWGAATWHLIYKSWTERKRRKSTAWLRQVEKYRP